MSRVVSADEARALREAATPASVSLVNHYDLRASIEVRDGDVGAVITLLGSAFDLAATVEALHAEVAALRAQVAEARDAERDAVVAWLRAASPLWWSAACCVAADAHRGRS